MTSRFGWLWTSVLLVALFSLTACGGGGTSTPDVGPGPAFNLFVTASPDVGKGPLTVTFNATPSGGATPYTFAWDFDGDSVVDSNAATGQYIYSYTEGAGSTVATVVVTDGNGHQVTASRTITVTGVSTGGEDNPLLVSFNVDPQVGNVPFNAQFTALVSGGKPPYSYSWDFDGDGTVDSNLQNPLYTYEEIGQPAGAGNTNYVHYPVLRVEDSRNVVASNFDDNNNDGNPDYKLMIFAQPPAGGMSITAIANPTVGQAPLTVEFTGAVTGASDNVTFTWSFGDDTVSSPLKTSVATHTYLTAGQWKATVTVKDETTGETKTSAPLTINTQPSQGFDLDIVSDVQGGQVPFVVEFEAHPTNGQDPVTYQWDIFADATPAEATPSVGAAPGLPGLAVVTPDFTYRKNPAVHFGNTSGAAGNFSYVARCVATDANGNVAVSNLVRVVASPNTSYPYYECQRPNVVGELVFPIAAGTGESANPVYQPYMMPVPWSARANPAVASHPAGVTFVMGGEILDENGNFERLVDRGDSAFVFVPTQGGSGTNEGTLGKYNTAAMGTMIKLNDGTAPAFPSTPTAAPGSPEWPAAEGDTKVPVDWLPPRGDEDPPIAQPGPSKTLRSAPFNIVGSAAAVLVHERPETNPEGAYPGPGVNASATPPPDIKDRDHHGMPEPLLWTWPDSCVDGWVNNPCS